jgi:hypothetical protein
VLEVGFAVVVIVEFRTESSTQKESRTDLEFRFIRGSVTSERAVILLTSNVLLTGQPHSPSNSNSNDYKVSFSMIFLPLCMLCKYRMEMQNSSKLGSFLRSYSFQGQPSLYREQLCRHLSQNLVKSKLQELALLARSLT